MSFGLFNTRLYSASQPVPQPPPTPTPSQPPPAPLPTTPGPRAPAGICPHPTSKIIEKMLALGEKLANTKLRPYQLPFARRIIESVILEDVATLTGLFARQCVHPDTYVLTDAGPRPISALTPQTAILSAHGRRLTPTTVLATEKTEAKETRILTLHNGISLTCSLDHLLKLANNQWGMLSDGTVAEGAKLQVQVSLLADATPDDPSLSARCFYAAQLMAHKRYNSVLPHQLTLSIRPSDHDALLALLNVSFSRTRDRCIHSVEIGPAKEAEILAYAFANPRTTLHWLMKLATLEMGRNNRKQIPIITLPVRSNQQWYATLLYFLRHHGLSPTEHEGKLVFSGFENCQRLQPYFRDDALHGELAHYIDHYKARTGYMLAPADFMRVMKAHPHLKHWMKRSTFFFYRENGVLLCVLLNLLKKIGVTEQEAFAPLPDGQPLIPSVCFAPILRIDRGPTQPLIDIETLDQQFFGNTILQHNSGKTETIAVVCDAMMLLLPYLHHTYPDDKRFEKYRDGFWIGIFSPSQDQSKTTYDRMRTRLANDEGRRIMREYGISFEVNRGDTIRMSNGSLTRCQTASESAMIESKTYHLIIIEEAQDVSPKKIRKCLAGDTEIFIKVDDRPTPVQNGAWTIKLRDYIEAGFTYDVLTKDGWQQPTERHVNGIQPLYRLVGDRQLGWYIDATLNHQMWAKLGSLEAEPDYYTVSRLLQESVVFLASRGTASAELSWHQLERIHQIGLGETYCLTLPGRNFIANGLVSSNSISPMAASTAGTVVMIGTANTQLNDLYEQVDKNTRAAKKGGKINHFEVDHREVERHVPRYKKYIEKEKEKLGEDSDEFRMSYLNEWCFERGMAFTEAQLSHRTPENPHGILHPKLELLTFYRGFNPVSIGVDVGKAKDSTILTALEIDMQQPIELAYTTAYRKRLLGWLEMVGDNYTEQIPAMVRFIKEMQGSTVVVDTTSLGAVVYDYLDAALGDILILPYTFSLPSKSELYKALIHDVQSGRIIVPGSPLAMLSPQHKRFCFQMRTLIKEYKAGSDRSGYLSCHAPADKVDGVDPHDDYPDSLALANWGAKDEATYLAEPVENILHERGRNDFLRGR